ncbi:MAG TPA: molybdopterin cofactor-binding domain-containing protein, partial [Chloroflexota bacterium]|nr:molybdopterin cofactor-binding domain-containing protein [Chloroflexota bacterium]
MIVVDDPAAAPTIQAGAVVEEPRVDAKAKVTGQAQYCEDLPDLPGAVYGVAIRSPYAHARLRSVDASAVEGMSGVLGVIHPGNLEELHLHFDPDTTDQIFIALHNKARYDGDLLGMVAAVDRRTAELAVEAMDIAYEPLPPIFSPEEALAPDAPLIHEQAGTNVAIDDLLIWGEIDRGLAEADRIFEETYFSQSVSHHPMEPSCSFVVNFRPELLEFWVPTNNAFWLADAAVKLFGIPLERIRTRVPYVGGNFGGKDTCIEALIAAALSRKVQRPVRVIASAQDSFRVAARHAMTWKARIGVKDDGTLTAMDVDLKIDTGAYYTAAGIATRNALTAAFGAYRVPHLRVRTVTCYTNKTPAGTFRNTGKSQTTFGTDCAIDNIARQMGFDPIEFRLKNTYGLGETVGPATWNLSGEQVAAPKPLDSDVHEMIRRAMSAMGWERDESQNSKFKIQNGRLAYGRGLALSLRRGSATGEAEALATADETGTIHISHNAPEV